MTRVGLVLGAGGALGASWTAGALAALQKELTWDARTADAVVGTSAGAVIAAMLGGGVAVDALLNSQRGRQTDEVPFEYDYQAERARPPLPKLRVGSRSLLLRSARHPGQVHPLATFSAWMLEGRGNLDHIGSVVDQVVPRGDWPVTPPTRIVAMDYDSGARVSFGAADAPGCDFSSAVMASCAIPGWYAPVTIEGRRYVDGGTISRTNLDLVAGDGLDVVYLLAPMASLGGRPSSAAGRVEYVIRSVVNRRVRREAELVRASGTKVVVLAPGPEDLDAIGANLMDPSRRERVLDTSLRTSATAIRAALDATDDDDLTVAG
ncbi:MAG: patatin-like phospholipase family protein [Mycobacteriales bacterium]